MWMETVLLLKTTPAHQFETSPFKETVLLGVLVKKIKSPASNSSNVRQISAMTPATEFVTYEIDHGGARPWF